METRAGSLHASVHAPARKTGSLTAAPTCACACPRRSRIITAASQNNNGLGSAYQPHSKATRTATAPPPQLDASSATGINSQASYDASAAQPFTVSWDADTVSAPQLKQWLKTPFDLLALGPRATLGALLNASELAQSLPAEIEKFQMLAQDPRPLQDKQAVFAQELQTTVASLVERGVVAESEIVAVLQQVLPEQLQQLIPAEMKAAAVQKPEVVQQQAQEAAYEEPPLSAEQLSIGQSGEELAQLKTAVTGVKEALADLKANADPAKASVIKLNVRDARDSLRRRLQQLSPETTAIQGAPVTAAKSEASNLLAEVDAVLTSKPEKKTRKNQKAGAQ